jgi:hypothetical protein
MSHQLPPIRFCRDSPGFLCLSLVSRICTYPTQVSYLHKPTQLTHIPAAAATVCMSSFAFRQQERSKKLEGNI